MRAGQVFVNCYGAGGGIELPFGGFGRSGHGREKGFEGLVEFTTTKHPRHRARISQLDLTSGEILMNRLEGKVALVTGAGSGFGLGIAETFAREGAKVAIVDINEAAAKSAAEKIGASAIGLAADVSKAADVNAAVEKTVAAFGKLDIVVNNAGISHRNRPMLEVEEDEFDRVFAVNVKSIYLFAKAAVPLMQNQGGGAIINVGSTAGLRPRPGLTWYNSTKGAVHTMTKSMAVELAPEQDPRLRAGPRRRRDAAAGHLHGRGHAPEARAFRQLDPARPLLDPPGHRQRRPLPRLRRGQHDHRRGAGGRRGAVHLTQGSVIPRAPKALSPEIR